MGSSRNRKKAKAAAKGGGGPGSERGTGGGKAKAAGGFKFHEYTGPSTTTKRSSAGNSKRDEGGAKKSDEETQYELLLKQQQLFLQWQLDLSHQVHKKQFPALIVIDLKAHDFLFRYPPNPACDTKHDRGVTASRGQTNFTCLKADNFLWTNDPARPCCISAFGPHPSR